MSVQSESPMAPSAGPAPSPSGGSPREGIARAWRVVTQGRWPILQVVLLVGLFLFGSATIDGYNGEPSIKSMLVLASLLGTLPIGYLLWAAWNDPARLGQRAVLDVVLDVELVVLDPDQLSRGRQRPVRPFEEERRDLVDVAHRLVHLPAVVAPGALGPLEQMQAAHVHRHRASSR